MSGDVVLLRGVNVGGHNRVPMGELRRVLEQRGLGDVRTYLQSGNAVVRSGTREPDAVAALVHDAVVEAFDVDCAVLVRTGAELVDVVARNPWPERAASPKLLNVAFLSAPPAEDAEPTRVGDDEQVAVDGRHAYVWYGSGQARTRLSLAPLGVTATVRNWTTVLALAELAAD